ncbi:ABC transporter ATP-binding protein [Helcococcus kunzii]|uniref:ABC transporter ATP-binding protein n=1 Tax=Helcococcus kunzii TaxID=40091 RepID=UPI0024ACE48A|nr:ABC transporter ATP-binding protein [Helcococcus kunzii]
MIKIQKLNKYYNFKKENELHVLKDIDFNVEKNEYISIMGTSGVGKSTLLNIIGGVENFESGLYFFDGLDMAKASARKLDKIRGKEISFIFQEYLLIENQTVLENIKVPLIFDKKVKASQMDKMALEALKNVGLDESLKNKKVSKLSGGQKQRVAIARAISNNPKLLLADEPTGAVDAETSKEILDLFKSLVNNDRTIIIVTHDINVAKQTDKIYEMIDGKLQLK